MATERGATHVELSAISKRFGGVRALDAVSLTVARGQVHALVGENGAGKSTLGRIVAGVLAADGGELRLAGEPMSLRSPREALERGIATIAQEPTLVPRLSVAENVFLGAEPRSTGFLRRRALGRRYAALAGRAGFDLPGDAPAGSLRTGQQQKVEILRALAREAELIVMDEPSAALSGPEKEQLHEIVRTLQGNGTTVLLVSHDLREVLSLAATVTILRDGRVVRTAPAAEETESKLIQGDARSLARRGLPGQAHPAARGARCPVGRGPARARRQRRVAGGARGRDRRPRGARRRGAHRARAGDLRRSASGERGRWQWDVGAWAGRGRARACAPAWR